MRFVVSLIWRPNLPSDTVSLEFVFKLIIILWKSTQFFFYRHGTIDYFVTVQIPSFGTDCRLWWWGVRGHGWDDTVDHQLCSCTVFDDTEFASRSGAEQCGSYQWAITCSISVESFCIWWHSDVAKMCMAPKKCTIYTKFGNECDPWVSVSLHKLVISYFYLIN